MKIDGVDYIIMPPDIYLKMSEDAKIGRAWKEYIPILEEENKKTEKALEAKDIKIEKLEKKNKILMPIAITGIAVSILESVILFKELSR